MVLRLLLPVCCVCLVTVNLCQSLKRCGTDEYYVTRRNGNIKCISCPVCVGGGIGYNTSVVREEDEYGYKTCYSCEQCAEGTYRTLKSHSSYCYLCMLDCARTFRYESVSCGGDTEGHCGDCLAGLKPESSEPNSMCFPDPDVASPTLTPQYNKPDVDTSITGDQMKPTDDRVKEDSEEKKDIKVLVISMVAAFAAVCMLICCVLYYCNKHVSERRSSGVANGSAIHSKVHLIGNSVISVASDRTGVSGKNGQLLEKPISLTNFIDEVEGLEIGVPLLEGNLPDTSLDVDSPEVILADTPYVDVKVDRTGPGNREVFVDTDDRPEDGQVRGELQSHDDHIEGIGLPHVLNENIPIIHENIPTTQVGIQPVQDRLVTQAKTIKSYRYYNRLLQKDDDTLTVAASRIHGKKRHELFQTYLKLSEQKISAYDEKWIRDTHNYPFSDNMLDCLKHWLMKHGTDANLKWLLESLKKADFDDIAFDIVKLSENQLPENFSESDVNIMCIDLIH